MPKGGGKYKGGKYDRHHDGYPHDEDSLNDNASVLSNNSDLKSVDEDNNGIDEIAQQERFEEKLNELIDGLTQKSSQGRYNCIQSLCQSLVKKYIPNFVRERHFTICDAVERCLKKGSIAERGAAADLASILGLQLSEESADEIIESNLKQLLQQISLDKTISPIVRGKCCLSLGILGLLYISEYEDTLELMKILESIFAGSYLRGDSSISNVDQDVGYMHASALSAWSLLFSNLESDNIVELIESKVIPPFFQLSELLESIHLEVRLNAGEALALIFEEGRNQDEYFCIEFGEEIEFMVKKLATDSNKFRAKKDRKQQRATFRDILHFFENEQVPESQVKFGSETLTLDTFAKRKQYEALCSLLGPSINVHLSENELLRDLFDLEAPVISALPARMAHKVDRHRKRIGYALSGKARTISRGKNRDKRSDFQ